jgi:hypothetical protein
MPEQSHMMQNYTKFAEIMPEQFHIMQNYTTFAEI